MNFNGKRSSKDDNNISDNSSLPLDNELSEDDQLQSHVQITVPPVEELLLNTSPGGTLPGKMPVIEEPEADVPDALPRNEALDDTDALNAALYELLGGTADDFSKYSTVETAGKSSNVMPDKPANVPEISQASTSAPEPAVAKSVPPQPVPESARTVAPTPKNAQPAAPQPVPKDARPIVSPPVQDAAPVTAPAPDLQAYPDVKISDKQMAALQNALGPSTDKLSRQADGKKESSKKTSRGSSNKKSSQVSIDKMLEQEDKKSRAKTATLVIFIVLIVVAAGLGGLYYWWTEHATFEYSLQPIVILEGQSIAPNEFLDPEMNNTGISAAFENTNFEPVVGLQFVPLSLSKGFRTLESAAALYVLTPVEYIERELAEDGTIRPIETLNNPEVAARVNFDVRFIENPLPLEQYPIGDFPLHLALNDAPFEIMLRIIDTTPPTATPVDQTIQVGDEVLAESFVTDVFDMSPPITVAFVDYPNVHAREDQTVLVTVTDDFGNASTFSAVLTIIFNQEPPEIDGAPHVIEFEIGHPVDYLQGVTAIDDFGRDIEVQIDLLGVDENTEGTYTATYYAEDYSGLRTVVEVTVHVISVNPDYVNERVDEILARILRDGMTQERKALEIHNWVRWTLSPANVERDTDSVTAAAYRAINSRSGDSHTYAAISELLLTRAGIPNMRIQRSPDAETTHFWLIIDPDEKGWHHFDAFPTGVSGLNNRTSMFTDAQAKSFAERIEAAGGAEGYYTYNPDLYPEIVQGSD